MFLTLGPELEVAATEDRESRHGGDESNLNRPSCHLISVNPDTYVCMYFISVCR